MHRTPPATRSILRPGGRWVDNHCATEPIARNRTREAAPSRHPRSLRFPSNQVAQGRDGVLGQDVRRWWLRSVPAMGRRG